MTMSERTTAPAGVFAAYSTAASPTAKSKAFVTRCLPVLSALLFLVAASSATAQTVRVNWLTKAPFSSYRTYAWKSSKDLGSAFYRQWVVKDVNAALAAKGLREVSASAKPDLYVYYTNVTKQIMVTSPMAGGYGMYGAEDGGFGDEGGDGEDGGDMGDMGDMGGYSGYQIVARPQLVGTLRVELVGPGGKKMVWRGQATTEHVSSTQKGDEKQVLKSVQDMFKQYPPRNS